MVAIAYPLVALAAAAVLAGLITPLVIVLYRHFRLVDDPSSSRHPKIVHRYPVPRGGGIAIFGAITVAALLFLPADKHLVGILIGLGILMLTGLVDDIFNIHPLWRLILVVLAGAAVVAAGIGIPFISNPIGGTIPLNQPQIPFYWLGKWRTIWLLADLFALIWIVSLSNFTNWSSGLDGQLAGMIIVASLTIGVFSLRFSADITQWPVIVLAFITAGAYLGFLGFNFYPQKIMTGYGGGTMGGYMLAVLSILATTKVGTIAFVLAIPVIDALYSILRRLYRKKSPWWGDAGHLHHKLMLLGWGKRRIAVFYWILTGILGVLALYLGPMAKIAILTIVSLLLTAFMIWIKYFRIR